MSKQIIIIGAGAAGLQAARRLCQAGNTVTVLEAAAEPGGRILSFPAGTPGGFSMITEGGAEFIHGELPLTEALAREAGVHLTAVDAKMERVPDEGGSGMDWGLLFQRMKMLPEDKPLNDFLNAELPGPEHAALRESAQRMAEGYDLADLHTVSTRSLYREWAGEHDEVQYRCEGGYRRLIDHLVSDCVRHGCRVCLSTAVSFVRWERGRVFVETFNGQVFEGEIVITTVSLGVLKAGMIRFQPDLPAQWRAVSDLGYGSVIKVLLEFDRAFWESAGPGLRKEAGRTLFVLSDEAVATWWTQSADDCPLITAWISGDRMRVFRRLEEAGRLKSCLRSLAAIFGVDISVLRASLRVWKVMDWESAPFVRGGYSFETIGSAAARRLLSQPVEGTLYFAGEGLYDGDVPGTVEAAFCSGVTVAEDVLRDGSMRLP